MAKKIRNASIKVGSYTDHNGKEKGRYKTIGAMYKNDDGTVSMKVDAMPVGEAAANWNGWVNFYETDEVRQANAAKGIADARAAMQPKAQTIEPPPEDDIPF